MKAVSLETLEMQCIQIVKEMRDEGCTDYDWMACSSAYIMLLTDLFPDWDRTAFRVATTGCTPEQARAQA